MIQSTVKRSDINLFVGSPVTSIHVGEFVIGLFFGHDRQMNIASHWELVEMKTNTMVDRALALKMRDGFLLFKLIGVRLKSYVKYPHQVELLFENDLKLIVY